MNEVAERLKEKGFSTSDVKGTRDLSSSAHLAAIGVTNQRETSIVWDKVTGMPLFNAIGLPSPSFSFVDLSSMAGHAHLWDCGKTHSCHSNKR